MDKDNELIIKQNTISLLEKLKREDTNNSEYWLARDLQSLFGYTEWRNFKEKAIQKAQRSCESIGASIENHFVDTNKMVDIGSGTKRKIDDMALSRYACYLIAMNGEPSKLEIAVAQAYFAVQTRKQELAEQQDELESRLALRNRVKDNNRILGSIAQNAGVEKLAIFQNRGYKGLYGGLGVKEIKNKKHIPIKEDLLDCMGRTELAANDFRITQMQDKLLREQIDNEAEAIQTHENVGKEVRNTIKKLGGTLPEDLPPATSIKQLEKSKKQKPKEIK